MTQYAYDVGRGTLIATWGTGAGNIALTLAAAPESARSDRLLVLTDALGRLSKAAWHTYTHPASACTSFEMNSEGWKRERERRAFADALQAVRHPDLPMEGPIKVNFSPVLEAGHRIGHALHQLGDTQFTAKITAEVEAELAAIEQADLGDLSGRAQQAVLLTRQDASPAQVAAADALLRDIPFGPKDLFTKIDSTAAAVAAAHWLQAAADVVAERSGRNPASVVVEAYHLEALPHETVTRVLKLVNSGASPRQAVVRLVQDAIRVAEGGVPDVHSLLVQINKAEEVIQHQANRDQALADELRHTLITPLDPQRPARDLLEDLLTGVHACWKLFEEDADISGEWLDDEEDWLAEDADDLTDGHRQAFVELVRTEAAVKSERLL